MEMDRSHGEITSREVAQKSFRMISKKTQKGGAPGRLKGGKTICLTDGDG